MFPPLPASLPPEEVDHVPQPAVSLVKSLLDKDPARRPQTPYELHCLLRELTTALDPRGQVESRSVTGAATEDWQGEAQHHNRLDCGRTAIQLAPRRKKRDWRWRLSTEPLD